MVSDGHSPVCLSDIWYGLYYDENEKPEKNEFDDDMEDDSSLNSSNYLGSDEGSSSSSSRF